MAAENEGKVSATAGGGAKQKIMTVATILILLVVGYNVMGLFKNGSGAAAPAPASPATPAAPTAAMNPGTPGATPASAAGTGLSQSTSLQQPQAQQSGMQINTTMLKLQQETEAKYLAAVNELQMLKIQREIAETNQAITKSKLETVTSEKNISDLLIKPAPPPIPETAFRSGQKLDDLPGMGDAGPINKPPTSTIITPPVQAQAQSTAQATYVVFSVAKQGNKWNAVIGSGTKLVNVTVGDNLPADGALVVSIGNEGVVLRKDGKERKVSINSAI